MENLEKCQAFFCGGGQGAHPLPKVVLSRHLTTKLIFGILVLTKSKREGSKMQLTIQLKNANQDKMAVGHNLRDETVVDGENRKENGKIDKDGVHETWRHETVQQAYRRIFDAALSEYNAKQKRADRKIADYFKAIQADKQKNTSYEMVMKLGRMEDNLDSDTIKPILRQYFDEFAKANPNIEIFGAYYHADERGAPHVHIDYIPVARDCKRGLATQNSLTKALEQMGFKTEKDRQTAQIQWEESEKKRLAEICRQHGIEIVKAPIERTALKTSTTEEFIELKEQKKEIEMRQKQAEQDIKNAKEAQEKAKSDINLLQNCNGWATNIMQDFPQPQKHEKTIGFAQRAFNWAEQTIKSIWLSLKAAEKKIESLNKQITQASYAALQAQAESRDIQENLQQKISEALPAKQKEWHDSFVEKELAPLQKKHDDLRDLVYFCKKKWVFKHSKTGEHIPVSDGGLMKMAELAHNWQHFDPQFLRKTADEIEQKHCNNWAEVAEYDKKQAEIAAKRKRGANYRTL